MNKKYLDSRKGSVEATINTIRTEQKTIVKEEPKVSLQPKSYFGQKKDSLADVAAKVVSVNEDTNIYIGNDKKKKEEDVDVDSVNDMALKNAEKHKSKDKESEGKESKSLTKEEQDHIKKEFGIKYEALSPEKQKQMDKLMKDFLARGGKIQKIAPGVKSDADKVKSKKRPLAAQKDSSDELAGGKTATGQKVSKVDTRPNIREV